MHPLAKLDHAFVWHPFTQMKDWLRREPIVIAEGRGAVLRDIHGREYLDANASIWTNLHGHRHPKLNAALTRQLRKIAHSSALGLANEPAALLAARLVAAVNAPFAARRSPPTAKPLRANALAARVPPAPYPISPAAPAALTKVFFSDDGATAMEVALKLAYEFARRTGRSPRPKFLSLQGAYHGDTIGAVSLGHLDLFHKSYGGLTFKTDRVMAPYCYRCPFNRAQPERADAREYRHCHWECVDIVERKFAAQRRRGNPYAALVVEPLIQGAAGMIPQPAGWLRRVAEIARGHGALWIADEVMTGFGRTGVPPQIETELRAEGNNRRHARRGDAGVAPFQSHYALFASHLEGVQPDLMALAKGMTGGYLPMAATLTTRAVFDAFLGEYEEFKTFFHGHSYTANQLGAAAALASLDLLQSPASLRARRRLEATLRAALKSLWSLPHVGDIRQVGLIVGVELVRDWRTRAPFDLRARAGQRVCDALARRGVLTRPIGNVIVLMPPYCTTAQQAETIVAALRDSIAELRQH